MQEENKTIDVGEADEVTTEIDLDKTTEQTESVEKEEIKVEEVAEEKPQTEATESQEEKKTDELEKYSDGVQKRIAKLTRKMREAERQREEAVAFAQSAKKDKEELQNRFSKLDKSYVDEFESRVTTNMDAARSALKTAIEAQDVDAQVKAQEQIATLTADAARLASLKTLKEEQPKQEKEVNVNPQQTDRQAKIDPKADAWASRNSWFGNDTAMTYTAFDIHKALVEREGYDPQSEEYYTEVDKRIRLEFPNKFDKVADNTTERTKPVQNVASARRPAQTGRKRTVKLTPSQVAIAKRLGVPLEEYAKQLNVKEGA